MTFSFQSVLLAACLLLQSVTANTNDVRGSSQQHRSLAGFVMPFQIRWRFNIAEGSGFPEDRQPTDAEYEGIRQANIDWFTVEIPFFYADESGFTFREIDCSLTDTTYTPGEDWVHNIVQFCEAIWDADAMSDLPTVSEFLVDMNANYLLDNFVANHLRSADPQDPRSLFQFASRVGYVTTNSGTTSPLPTDGTPAPATSMPVMAPTTAAPVMAPTTAAPVMAPVMPPTGTPGPTMLPQKKDAPPAKCGSLASANGRGGAAAQAKDCSSGRLSAPEGGGGRRKRKLKGSNY